MTTHKITYSGKIEGKILLNPDSSLEAHPAKQLGYQPCRARYTPIGSAFRIIPVDSFNKLIAI